GRLRHCLGEDFACPVEDVERFREARGQAPFQLRRGLRGRRLGDRSRGSDKACGLQELATLHFDDPLSHWATRERVRQQAHLMQKCSTITIDTNCGRASSTSDIHIELHLWMDAAEYQERSGLRERDLHG